MKCDKCMNSLFAKIGNALIKVAIAWAFVELFLLIILPGKFSTGILSADELLVGIYAIFFDNVAGILVEPKDALINSFFRTLCSIVFSAFAGIVIGILIISMGKIGRYFNTLIDYLRGIPVTFLIPFSYLTSGIAHSWWLPVTLTCVPCSLIVGMAIVEQGRKIEPDRRVMAESLLGRAQRLAYWRHFALWEVLSGFLIGLKAIVPYATVLIGVLEFVGLGGSEKGFGYLIFLLTGNTSDDAIIIPLISAVIAYGIFSLGFLVVIGSVIGWLTSLLGLEEREEI